ncbi:MAG TPA: YncE family protein [Terriglobales bacterium]
MKTSAFQTKDLCEIARADTSARHFAAYGRGARLGALLLLALFGPACGDYYRPVALPIPVNSPNPAALHFMYSVASAGSLSVGSVSQIDVTGDALTDVVNSGQSPVHAALTTDGSRAYVANSGDDTVTVISGAQPTTIDLAQLCPQTSPCPLVPVFAHSTEATRMYVADKGTGTVSVINTTSNAVVATVAVNPAFAGNPVPLPNPAAQPVALAEMPNGTKIYSINQGDSTVTSINTLDDSIAARITSFSAPPIWAVASSDNTHIYVLDQSATISVIDTLSDTVVGTAAAGAGANYIFYDRLSNRLYVTNQTASSVSIFDISGAALVAHAPISISASPSSACSTAAVGAGSPIPPVVPTAITVLGDDSRAYVASYQLYTANGATSVCTQADVIDNGTGLVTKTIPLYQATDNSSQTGCASARFRVFIAASGGGANTPFKVFVSQCDAGSIADIYTASATSGPDRHPADVLMASLPAPVTSSSSGQISISSASQSGSSTTYTYTPMTPTTLQVGTMVVITGMTDVGNNGVFLVSGIPAAGSFMVTNPSGVTTSAAQSGNGTSLTVGNPVFLVPGR